MPSYRDTLTARFADAIAFESFRLPERVFVDRRPSAYELVVVCDLVEPLFRYRASLGDELEERAYVFRLFGTSVSYEQYGIEFFTHCQQPYFF